MQAIKTARIAPEDLPYEVPTEILRDPSLSPLAKLVLGYALRHARRAEQVENVDGLQPGQVFLRIRARGGRPGIDRALGVADKTATRAVDTLIERGLLEVVMEPTPAQQRAGLCRVFAVCLTPPKSTTGGTGPVVEPTTVTPPKSTTGDAPQIYDTLTGSRDNPSSRDVVEGSGARENLPLEMEIPVPTDEAQRIRDQVARKVWKGSGVTVLDGPTGDRWTRLVRRHLGDTQTWDGWMQIIAGWENLTPWQIRHLLRHDQCAKVWLECVLASKPKRTRLEREANAADERRRRSLAKIAEMEAQENTTQEAGR